MRWQTKKQRRKMQATWRKMSDIGARVAQIKKATGNYDEDAAERLLPNYVRGK